MAVLAAAALAGGGVAQALAQSAVPESPAAAANPQPWTISCAGQGASGGLVCSMSQGLIAKNTGQRVLGVTIARDPASGAYSARLSLPHGLLLPEGVQIWIDEGARARHPITTADQHGSYAAVPLDQAMIAAMKKGTILNVSVKSASGDEVIFQLSLNGFTAALAKV